uniref:Uncharacterized protein n=1 Tax=Lotharella oceanica TaxID=641309 RepID=A0A7S2TFR3_9EUKA
MDELDITEIDNVTYPDKVAELVGPMNADVLFIKYFMQPWTGEIILQALSNMARKKGYKRPKYIIGLDDSYSGLREMISHGSDGYIKINWLHGWDKWPRIDPEPYIVTNKTRDNFAEGPLKMKQQMAYGRFRFKLERMLAEGKLDPYRNDVSGFQNFLIDYPFANVFTKTWMEALLKVEPDPENLEMDFKLLDIYEIERIFYELLDIKPHKKREFLPEDEPLFEHIYGTKYKNGSTVYISEEEYRKKMETEEKGQLNMAQKLRQWEEGEFDIDEADELPDSEEERERRKKEREDEKRRREEAEKAREREKERQEEEEQKRQKEEQYKQYP